MKTKLLTRRRFLFLAGSALPAAAGLEAGWLEPTSLRLTRLGLREQRGCRFLHFSDFHYKGDARYAAEVVAAINALSPQFVCFTGDLVEDRRFARAALEFIRQIRVPVYGSPGNHEYTSGISFSRIEEAFAATGGAWLADRCIVLPKHDLELVGLGIKGFGEMKRLPASRHFLLVHYPAMADRLEGNRFDLILAGHSHGGQVRLPFFGSLILPRGVGAYDCGYYETAGGPLYVNVGVGTYSLPIRLNCRPELTLVSA
jgi:predicted MPP superfamily phosphohydrolase